MKNMIESGPRAKEIWEGLAQFYGTEQWYRHFVPGVLFTDGMRYLADEAQAYWLIDAVASWQVEAPVKRESFQHWVLKVNEDESAVLIGDDGNGNEIARQEIEYTDFPLPYIELYVSADDRARVIMLPSEY